MYETLYSHNNDAGNINKTVLIDFDNKPANIFIPSTPQSATETLNQHKDTSTQANNRKIIGVLFSVSRFNNGEIFPVYEGENTIGHNINNDIILSEASIDELHAILYATHDDYPNTDYTLSIHDQGSTYGTMVGSDDVIFNPHTVHDNDIIFLGNHYQLLVRLFEQEAHKLFTSDTFQATEDTVKFKTQHKEELPPEAIPSIEFYRPSQNSQNSTITKSY